MSKNISNLSGRKGLDDNLFERLVKTGAQPRESAPDTYRQLARDYLLGEAITYGAASFYDLLKEEHVGKKVLVCNGTACLCAGTQEGVVEQLCDHLDESEIGAITCLGRCHENSAFYYNGRNYSGDDIEKFGDIVRNPTAAPEDEYHVESVLDPPILTAPFPGLDAFYKNFREQILGGDREALVEQVKASKLRGRGGAGFPTGFKWDSCRQTASEKKYIVCNADEGDPGAYIDRYLLEKQPHLVLCGMLCAGFIVGADEGVLYIRAEYPESVKTIENAIKELEDAGYVGNNILGSEFSFRFKVIQGAGSYICGEETALLASLEGRRPEVSIRPPFPTTYGLFGKPTVVNNVETFSCVHHVFEIGGDAFAEIGTDRSTGPKLLSLDGLFNRPGLYEVPAGYPLIDVIEKLGQGFRRPVKALQIGGPLGGIVPAEKFGELTVDFESFRNAGFLLGHASVVSIPEDFPMVKFLEHLFEFCAVESCGKCFPCRLGATRGQEMMEGALKGEHKLDRQLLDDLLETMQLGSLCAHGGGIPLPIKNALQYFSEELEPYFQTGAVA